MRWLMGYRRLGWSSPELRDDRQAPCRIQVRREGLQSGFQDRAVRPWANGLDALYHIDPGRDEVQDVPLAQVVAMRLISACQTRSSGALRLRVAATKKGVCHESQGDLDECSRQRPHCPHGRRSLVERMLEARSMSLSRSLSSRGLI